MSRRPRLTIGRVMIGIAALAVWIWVAGLHPGALLFSLFVAMQVGIFFVSRPSYSGARPVPRARRFQFSIWHYLVVAVFAAF